MSSAIVDFTKTSLSEVYGINCFNDATMKARLPKAIYKEFKKVTTGEINLSLEVANVIANTMKDWAIEKGATHFTHWFQPLTGSTAEKHDSFINPTEAGGVLIEFSGKELIQGEPDASSFPNGGLRATFEARGYTAWDTSSPAFLKEDLSGITLYIPTAFISYTGEALDKKVPLLKSMEVVEKEALRVLKALGNTTSSQITTTVGPEQEYFLVDKEYYNARPDLLLTGRTLFGAIPSKGQEMDDHYFGEIKERVAGFMKELDCELWKLGVPSKTKHNEVAPNQFELAAVYTKCNVATDNNHLVMESMKKIASRHGLVALLHEKPFAGVNGSGKHNNWSLSTNDGMNLLEPGDNPHDNAQFLLFLTAIIEAVDRYAPLLRLSAANAGNDHRLGANEAPPAIISIFLGHELNDILVKLANGEAIPAKEGGKLELGVNSLPNFPKDLTDRNRTSPFAFTGNKFEFRMVASSASIAGANVMLNAAVAKVLASFAEKLEKAENVNEAIKNIIATSYNAHKRVVFNGNGYSDEWVAEAEKRGLPNLTSTVDVLPEGVSESTMELFTSLKIFTKEELESRFNIYSEEYSMQINIEANVTIEMANLQIFPAANEYATKLANSIKVFEEVMPDMNALPQKRVLKEVLENIRGLRQKTTELEKALEVAQGLEEYEQAKAYKESVLAKMNEVREFGDALEKIVSKELWPFPTYQELLFKL